MKKYRKKPVVIEAEQWFKLGDVPEANIEYITKLEDFIDYINFDTVDIIKFTCEVCGKSIYKHGIIDTLEGKHIVCPGDYVVKDIKGEFYPVKESIFKETYEEINDNEDEEMKKYIQDYMRKLREMGNSDYRPIQLPIMIDYHLDSANPDWIKYSKAIYELFSSSRGFTKEEAESYNESLSKLFVKVDDNIFDESNKSK